MQVRAWGEAGTGFRRLGPRVVDSHLARVRVRVRVRVRARVRVRVRARVRVGVGVVHERVPG